MFLQVETARDRQRLLAVFEGMRQVAKVVRASHLHLVPKNPGLRRFVGQFLRERKRLDRERVGSLDVVLRERQGIQDRERHQGAEFQAAVMGFVGAAQHLLIIGERFVKASGDLKRAPAPAEESQQRRRLDHRQPRHRDGKCIGIMRNGLDHRVLACGDITCSHEVAEGSRFIAGLGEMLSQHGCQLIGTRRECALQQVANHEVQSLAVGFDQALRKHDAAQRSEAAG